MQKISQMKNLRQASLEELQALMKEWNEPKFRASQIHEWIWKMHAASIEEMTNLSKELRQKLNQYYFIPKVTIDYSQYSEDGTIKNRLRLHDALITESVLIPTDDRMTVCVSSQVGCSLSCKFCATGYIKRSRSLDYDEIVDEITLANEQAKEHFGRHLTNIVFMGMGEPLLNYNNLMKAIDKITSPEGLGMSPKRITVSTAGVTKMIKKLGDDMVKFKLAVSLHAANDEKRSKIMPINDTNDLNMLMESIIYYYSKTKNPITLEYILFKNLNDSLADAEELVKFYRRVPADLVNLIEYNEIDDAQFSKPDEKVVDQFMEYLASQRVNARLRRSRGKDIDAACGQLANKEQTN